MAWCLCVLILSIGFAVVLEREYKYGQISVNSACSEDSLRVDCGEELSAGSEDVFPVIYSEELPHQ